MFPYKKDIFLQELMNITYALRELAEDRWVDWIPAIAAGASMIISAIAICRTNVIAKEQNKIAMFQERSSLYSKILKNSMLLNSVICSLESVDHSQFIEKLEHDLNFLRGHNIVNYEFITLKDELAKKVRYQIITDMVETQTKIPFLFSQEIFHEYSTLNSNFCKFLDSIQNNESYIEPFTRLQEANTHFQENTMPQMMRYIDLNYKK